jgi:hypothetical protein
MTANQARAQSSASTIALEKYKVSGGIVPSDDFVVTRNRDGSALSRYGELIWDRTPYDPIGRTTTLVFAFWSDGVLTPRRDQLARESRWLMFLLIHLRRGRSLSNASLNGYLQAFHQIARFCEVRSMRIQDLLANPVLVIESFEERTHLAGALASLIVLLNYLGPEVIGFDVVNNESVRSLRKYGRARQDDEKQHAPLPTRLYSVILSALAQELDAFDLVANRILNLFEACAGDPMMGRHRKYQRSIAERLNLEDGTTRPMFPDLLRKHDLESYWSARGYAKTVLGLSTALTEVMATAAFQIQAFTGMRSNEVRSLPYHCLDKIKRDEDDSIHYIVRGQVTKHAHGMIKRVQWVTSESGRAAVELAQRIAKTIYKVRGEIPKESRTHINSHHLFISPVFATRRRRNVPAGLELAVYPALRSRLEPIVQEEDLLELEQIDPHRAWRTEAAFQIGQRWSLKSHQLRRSLALYAQRSGLVSLPSLKRQLQHITHEMSMYYCRGSSFAKDFIGDGHEEKHFGEEWQETQPVSQFLSYAAHVLLTDETLFGVHPHWITNRLRNSEGVVLFDRAVTLRRFQKGELAYQETPLGGCVKVGECDKNPFDLLHVECIASHCKNLVGNKTKLERIIAAQTSRVDNLKQIHPKSPEYRHEKADLVVLKKTLEMVLGNSGSLESTA